MSEFHVVVVEVGKFAKHPNADTLSITQVMDAYPCIFRTGEFQEGDKAVYVPVDALVPTTDPRFAFLGDTSGKTFAKIKAKKLRGIFSMGLLVKADPDMEVGTNVQERMGIRKWEPELDKFTTNGECEKDPGYLPVYTDIEGLRKYRNLLDAFEPVVLMEKIHGANARFCYRDDRLWCGSHKQIKREDPNILWWKAANRANLKEVLARKPNLVFYGEVYGQVQDLKYGEQLDVRFFDIFDPAQGKYLDWPDLKATLEELGLKLAPVLYEGPWQQDLMDSLSNGKTTLNADHCREGFVVRPIKERWNDHVGRVIFKMVGQDYLLRKQKD
jgi:RNA ligase (TIGR02306 family)